MQFFVEADTRVEFVVNEPELILKQTVGYSAWVNLTLGKPAGTKFVFRRHRFQIGGKEYVWLHGASFGLVSPCWRFLIK